MKIRVFLHCLLVLFTLTVFSQEKDKEKSQVTFTEKQEVIDLEQRSRRKFDNAVIADLDQDGWMDLLLTEHARRVEVYWNNEGVFEKGEPFIFGDTHGIAVSDIDRNGLMDVYVQPGGGGGKKPSQTLIFQVDKDREIKLRDTLLHFERNRGRAVKFIDVDQNGKPDMVTSAFAARKSLSHANFLYQRDEELIFKFVNYLPYGDRFGMRTTLTDFNNDGIFDLIFSGGSSLVSVEMNKDFTFSDVSEEVLGNLANLDNVSSVSEIDYDNDGDFDLFITRCKSPFGREADYDEENNRFYFFARTKPFLYDSIRIEGDFLLENLQMAFPDFDVYIGATKRLFERSHDQHGDHHIKMSPKNAQGWPEDTSENGLYIGHLGNGFWRVGGFTKSPTSAVIHGVLSSPETMPLEQMPAKLLENQEGVFVDVSSQLGIDIKEQTSSSAVGDFNNDGWADIFVLRYGNPASTTKQILYLNQSGEGFQRVDGHGIVTKELGSTGMGAEAFDYDKDGDLDIVCNNERGRWHLFTNDLDNSNKYVEVKVGDSPSGGAGPIGAVLTLEACDNIYRRVAGSTSSPYSQSLNTYLHIGLGLCQSIESAIVTWSNGEEQTLDIKKLNKIYTAGQ